jgi:beta-glucanase (GH16 family)
MKILPSLHPKIICRLLTCCCVLVSAMATAERYQAEDYTQSYDTSTGNSGGVYRTDNTDIEATSDSDGAYNIGWIAAGEWLSYQNVNIPTSGNYLINARVASTTGATFSADLNAGAIQLATFEVPNTGGWQAWSTVSATVYIDAGNYSLGVFAQTANWNFNWIEIIPVAAELTGDVVWAVNAGGQEYTSSDNITYRADEGFIDGATASTNTTIDATPDSTIYQTERWGSQFDYVKDLPNGLYSVTFRFAEIYWQSAGARQFSVNIEGQIKIANVDIFADKGHRTNAAYDLTVRDVIVQDGQLNMHFSAIVDAAKVSAFVVRKPHVAEPAWQLVWQDEFNTDGAVDATKWTHELWDPKRVNNERQRYTDRLDNARVESGKLIIEARKDNYMGDEYSSARIHTANKGDLLYGRIEVSAKLPNGVGTWPAIWMMPTDVFAYATTCDASTGWDEDCDAWPNSGEIDIMEHVGYDTGKVHATVHNLAGYWKNGQQRQAAVLDASVDDDFHVYAIEWTPEKIDMFIDNVQYFSYVNPQSGWLAWPYDKPFNLILNLAVGGDWGEAGGFDANIWPQRMEVDYVRMYQQP